MTIQATTRKSTYLLKKHLKDVYNIKTSIRSESYSGGSSLHISYKMGIDEKIISALANNLQQGNFNMMIDSYEYKKDCGLVIDGYNLVNFSYVFVDQEIDNDFIYKMAKMFSDNYSFNGIPKLKSKKDLYSYFDNGFCGSNTWNNLFHYFFKVRNFNTNDCDEIELTSCETVDGDLNNGIFFTYKLNGKNYTTLKHENLLKSIKKVITSTKHTPKIGKNENHINSDCTVVDYTEKAIAVFGNTYPKLLKLKAIGGGRFNRNLTNPINGEKECGWIFSKSKKNVVLNVL